MKSLVCRKISLLSAIIGLIIFNSNPVIAGSPPPPMPPAPTGNSNIDAVGTALFNACPGAFGSGAFFQDCRNASDVGGEALGALTPDEIFAVNTNITSSAVNDNFTRLGQLRNFGFPPGRVSNLNASSSFGGGASSDSLGSRLGVYINGHADWQEYTPQVLNPGFRLFDSRAMVGADYRFTDNFIAGLSASYLGSDTQLKFGAGNINSDGYSFTSYGSYYIGDQFFIDGMFGYSNQTHRIVRTQSYSGFNTVSQLTNADVDSDTYSAAVASGYNFNFNALTVTPTARWVYRNIQMDNYSESFSQAGVAGSALGLAVGAQDYESITGNFGVQLSYAWSQPWGVLIPHFSADYVHEFANNSVGINARFVNAPTGTGGFTIRNTVMDRDYVTLNTGFSAQFSHGVSGFVSYEKILDLSHLTSDSVSMGLRMELD